MSARPILLVCYVLVAIALLACEFAARRPTARVARIGDVVTAIKRHRAGWFVLLLAWWWLGFHVLARSSPVEP